MAKISQQQGPSDARQPGEPLHLRQPEVVPGSNPERAQEATTAAVLGEDNSEVSDVQPTDGTESTEPGPEPEDADPDAVVTRVDPPAPTYDPKDYTVEKVNEHLDELLAEDTDEARAEFDRIVLLEIDGKNRTGITSRAG